MSAKEAKSLPPKSASPLVGAHAVRRRVMSFLWIIAAIVFIVIIAVSFLGNTGSDSSSSQSTLGVLSIIGLIISVVALLLNGQIQPKTDNTTPTADLLNASRDKIKAFYDLSITLGSTLDYNRVLEVVQNVGVLGIREAGVKSKLVSMVLLFRQGDDHLHVVSSRGLPNQDKNMVVPGRRGTLGRALQDVEPVVDSTPHRDPELSSFTIFGRMRSALVIPLHAGYENYGVLVFGSGEENTFANDSTEWLTAIGTQATVALQNAVLYQNILHEKERIIAADEEARKKLARDLHDGPTQKVALIVTNSEFVKRRIKMGQIDEAQEEVAKIEELARKATKEIRHMLFTLRPLVLETQGILPALNQLSENMKNTHNFPVVIEAHPEVDGLIDENSQGNLFYVIEEAVNNAFKHARANEIRVRLRRQQEEVIIQVIDDGVGFDVAKVIDPNKYHERGSLGMVNMRERVEAIGGRYDIQSVIGKGTRITIRLPIRHNGKTSAEHGKKVLNPGDTLFGRRSN